MLRKNGSNALSADRAERLQALHEMLLPSVAAPFAGRECGTKFWHIRYYQFKNLLSKSDGLAGHVNKSVARKTPPSRSCARRCQGWYTD